MESPSEKLRKQGREGQDSLSPSGRMSPLIREKPTPKLSSPIMDKRTLGSPRLDPERMAQHEIPTSSQDPLELFIEYAKADTVENVMRLWDQFKEAMGEKDSKNMYRLTKEKFGNNQRLKELFMQLDKQWEEGKTNPRQGLRIVVIGGGPAGLRTAIQAAFLGCDIWVVEKRKQFGRNNLLHLWDSSISDIKTIGGKFFYPKLCWGGIHHISIRKLQLTLLKVALFLGVQMIWGFQFKDIIEPKEKSMFWNILLESKKKEELVLEANVLIGADGADSCVGKRVGLECKVFQGAEAIGITANLENRKTPEENQLNEFGLMSIYDRPFFESLKQQFDLDLENLVYYREENHYIVTTAKRDCLIRKQVIRENFSDMERLLAPSNVNRDKLEMMVREIASHIKLPNSTPFMVQKNGQTDICVFDFSKKRVASEASTVLHPENKAPLLVSLVGDALVEPFLATRDRC